MKHARTILSLLLAAAVLGALGMIVFRSGAPTPMTHSQGGKIRIVSVAPNTTEMLFALGVGNSIIGVTDYCDYPPEAKQIECIGGFGAPNVEKMLALRPDLVVAAGFERGEVPQVLRDAGIQVLDLKMNKLDDVFRGFEQIGQAVGESRRAAESVAAMRAELKSIASQFGDMPQKARPRVFIELWADPLITAGGPSVLDDVVARAGGLNVAHDLSQPHPQVSAEKVIEWNPDVIILTHTIAGGDPAAQMAKRIGWSGIAAVKKGRVICDISPDLILRPGPRLIEGIRALARALHAVPLESQPSTKNVLPDVSPLPLGEGQGVRAASDGQWPVVSGQRISEIANLQSLISLPTALTLTLSQRERGLLLAIPTHAPRNPS